MQLWEAQSTIHALESSNTCAPMSLFTTLLPHFRKLLLHGVRYSAFEPHKYGTVCWKSSDYVEGEVEDFGSWRVVCSVHRWTLGLNPPDLEAYNPNQAEPTTILRSASKTLSRLNIPCLRIDVSDICLNHPVKGGNRPDEKIIQPASDPWDDHADHRRDVQFQGRLRMFRPVYKSPQVRHTS